MKPGLQFKMLPWTKKKIFHERTRVVSKKSSAGSVDPNNYASGPMLCSSSVVPRLMKSVLKSAPIECFHGHTNISHELASSNHVTVWRV